MLFCFLKVRRPPRSCPFSLPAGVPAYGWGVGLGRVTRAGDRAGDGGRVGAGDWDKGGLRTGDGDRVLDRDGSGDGVGGGIDKGMGRGTGSR